jgi:hypothetical protein
MAEKLTRTQPTSSIANALNLDAVRAATDPTPEPAAHAAIPTQRATVVTVPIAPRTQMLQRQPATDPQPYASREPTGERAVVMRQFQLTPSADATLQGVIAAYSQATGLDVTRSEFLRAVLYALSHTVGFHEREARTIGRLKRPKNEARLFNMRDELERAIAKAFTAAMRAAPRME